MLKKLSLLVAAFVLAAVSIDSLASHTVRGYYRKNGTYVQPHKSMDPGESKSTGMSYHHDELVPRKEDSSDSYNSGLEN